MTKLFDLPLEVRDMITRYAILRYRLPPAAPTEEEFRGRINTRRGIDRTPHHHYDARFRTPLHDRQYANFEADIIMQMPASLALQLTNKQLHFETEAVIQRLSTEHTDLSLDIMIAWEHFVWPTWTFANNVLRNGAIRKLEVTVRVFGAKRKWARIQSKEDAWQWPFYYVLEHLLRCVPHGRWIEDESKQWSIQHLDINVLEANDQDLPSPNELLMDHPSLSQAPKAVEKRNKQQAVRNSEFTKQDPEWLVYPLANWFEAITDKHCDSVLHGMLVFKRIGKITIHGGQEIAEEIRPGSALMEETSHDPSDESLPYWARGAWKEEAEAERRKRGLPLD